MPWNSEWRSGWGGDAAALRRGERESKESRQYRKDREHMLKEIGDLKKALKDKKAGTGSGGKSAVAGRNRPAADTKPKREFWCCVGCNYQENFLSRQQCRKCTAARPAPEPSPPGLGGAASDQAVEAAAAAAAAAAATAAAGRWAVEAEKAARQAKEAEPMAVEGPVADRIAGLEVLVKHLRALKDTAGWAYAKDQVDAAEKEIKALREQQKAAKPYEHQLLASSGEVAKCKEATRLAEEEFAQFQIWGKLAAQRVEEARAQEAIAVRKNKDLLAKAGADAAGVQVKSFVEAMLLDLPGAGLGPDISNLVGQVLTHGFQQWVALGATAGAGGGVSPPAAAAKAVTQPFVAHGAPGVGPAVAARVAAGAAAQAAAVAGSQLPAGNQGWSMAGPAPAAGVNQGAAATADGSAAMAAVAAGVVAEAVRQAALGAMVVAGAGAQGFAPTPGVKRAWSLGRQPEPARQRQPDIREYGQLCTRGRTGYQQAPGMPVLALPGPTGIPVPPLPQGQTNLLANFNFPRGHVGMEVGTGRDDARSRSGRSASGAGR